jgi:predicted MFS family arabinose efflux permease
MDFVIRNSGASRKRKFESYRIWGSLGFMIPTIGLTWWFGHGHITASTLLMLSVTACLAAALCAIKLPNNSPSSSKAKLPSREAISAAIAPPLRGLFIANCFAGSALAIFYIMYPRFLQEIGCSTATIGLIINLGVLYEVILLPFSGRIISALGIKNVILLGFLSLPIRLFITVIWPTLPVAIATQLFHGPLVIGLLIGVPVFLQENAENSFRHSLQSLNTTINHGLTRIIGSAIGATLVGMGGQGTVLEGLLRAIFAAGALGALATACFAASSKRPTTERQN